MALIGGGTQPTIRKDTLLQTQACLAMWKWIADADMAGRAI